MHALGVHVDMVVGPHLGLGLGGFEDWGGRYLPTKFGSHLIILSSSSGSHKLNRCTVHSDWCIVDLWVPMIPGYGKDK